MGSHMTEYIPPNCFLVSNPMIHHDYVLVKIFQSDTRFLGLTTIKYGRTSPRLVLHSNQSAGDPSYVKHHLIQSTVEIRSPADHPLVQLHLRLD
jgi:ketopantoate reductase